MGILQNLSKKLEEWMKKATGGQDWTYKEGEGAYVVNRPGTIINRDAQPTPTFYPKNTLIAKSVKALGYPEPTPTVTPISIQAVLPTSTPRPTTTPIPMATSKPTSTPKQTQPINIIGSVLGAITSTFSPKPTPTSTPTPTPTPIPVPYQHKIEIPSSSGKGKTILPQNIAQAIMEAFDKSGEATTAAQILHHPDAPQVKGFGRGENASFRTGKEMDIPNRIDPVTGNYSQKAPIMQIYNPFTKKMEDSVDRGLFRINNKTFYDMQRRKPKLMEALGIKSWDDMLDPVKNAMMAKVIKDEGGWGRWCAAPLSIVNNENH